MDELDNWTPELEYCAVRVPDKMLIASILTEARGKRTMAQLAEACGVSASTLSRALNGKITKPMTVELIKKISMNADPPNQQLFERLVRANGLVPKDVYEKASKSKNRNLDRLRLVRDDEIKARNIVMAELVKRGVPVKLRYYQCKSIETDYLLYGVNIDFEIETDLGNGPQIWSFEVIPIKQWGSLWDHIYSPPASETQKQKVMQKMSGWFLVDAWEPEKLKGRLHTFVFLDKALYTVFRDHLIGPKVSNDFSFIALDMEKEKINYEIYMIRKDNYQHELIFDRPVIEPGNVDEEDDFWGIDREYDAFGYGEDNE